QVTALPEKALTVGDDWTRDVEVPMGPIGKAKARYDYTLEGLEPQGGTKCAKIGVKFGMEMDGKPDLSAFPGAGMFDIDLSFDGVEGEGALHFSPDLGRLMRSRLETHVEMNMHLIPKDEKACRNMPKMDMTMEMGQKTDMVLLGPDDPAFEREGKK